MIGNDPEKLLLLRGNFVLNGSYQVKQKNGKFYMPVNSSDEITEEDTPLNFIMNSPIPINNENYVPVNYYNEALTKVRDILNSRSEDKRAVADYYKYWETDAIKANLDTKRHNFSVLITNKLNDFNIGTIIRNSNAFLAKEVMIYGRRQFDKRGTVGAHHYQNISFLKQIEDISFPKEEYCVVAVENNIDSKPIDNFYWPADRHVIMIFGEETTGVPEELLDIAEHKVYIKQYGSTRSLNVGSASAIAMQDYCRKLV